MGKMRFSGSAVFGIILIAVGIISLLSGLNYFNSWYIFSTYWPLVIVLFGVKHMIDHRSSTMFGIILILVGAFLQVEQLNLWYFNDVNIKELIIPVIIILIGLNFVLPKGKSDKDDYVEAKVDKKETEVKVEVQEAEVKAEAKVEPQTEEQASQASGETVPEESTNDEEVEKVDAEFIDEQEA